MPEKHITIIIITTNVNSDAAQSMVDVYIFVQCPPNTRWMDLMVRRHWMFNLFLLFSYVRERERERWGRGRERGRRRGRESARVRVNKDDDKTEEWSMFDMLICLFVWF